LFLSRQSLVPLNHRYPIAAVIDAAREYAAVKGRRVTVALGLAKAEHGQRGQGRKH